MPDFERAVAFHVIALQTTSQNLTAPHWRRFFVHDSFEVVGRWNQERVNVVAKRFWNVQLENTDAVNLLERLCGIERAVIYVDPPYLTAFTQPYNVNQIDVEQMRELLSAQIGQVAISGYADEWDSLDWQRHELKTTRTNKPHESKGARPVVEVLWTNYDAYEHGSAYQGDQMKQGTMFDL